MQTVALNSEVNIPILGLGTWQLLRDECEFAVGKALEMGYRHIDTAKIYGNQRNVAKAIKNSEVGRGEIFITSKLWRTHHRADDVLTACKDTLDELETDYLDLYLIHWPNKDVPIQETLVAMQNLYEQKLVRAIGVSNFTIKHLEAALATGITIANNQVEFHPSLNQSQLQQFCEQHNIKLTAYSPIAQGADLKLPTIVEIAEQRKVTPAQVVINWLIAKGMIVIPKATTEAHLRDNWDAQTWQITPDEVAQIDKVGGNNRVVWPDFAEF